jgi:hypothetical protein
MHKTFLAVATVILFSSAAMAQSADTKGPATTGPAAQSGDNMSKESMPKGKMSKKKMSKSSKMKKSEKSRPTGRFCFWGAAAPCAAARLTEHRARTESVLALARRLRGFSSELCLLSFSHNAAIDFDKNK